MKTDTLVFKAHNKQTQPQKIICFRSGGWLELLISRRPNVFYKLLVISYVSVIHLKTSTLRCIDFFA